MIKNRGRGPGQGGCERRIKVFVLKNRGGGCWVGGGGQCECERRFEIFVKMQKSSGGGGLGRGRVGFGGMSGWIRGGGRAGDGGGGGGSGGCGRRGEVFVKNRGGGGVSGGVKADVN